LASEVLRARSANFGPAKLDICALALTEAVAPVNIKVGECVAGAPPASSMSRGRLA
jgi:hypothetical protein